jgi:hypothetical protein
MLSSFHRNLKRINILFFFLLLIFLILNSIFHFIKRREVISPKPLEIKDFNAKAAVENGKITYTLFIKVQNPNENFQAQKINYLFEIQDAQGKEITKLKEDTQCSTILPQNECNFEKPVTLASPAKSVIFKIENIQWK